MNARAKGSKGGRPAKGFQLRRPPGAKVWSVRFTAHGKQVERSTGEENQSSAAAIAAQIYAEHIAAPSPAPEQRSRRYVLAERPFGPAAAEWLRKAAGVSLRATTVRSYALYLNTHLKPAFPTIESITPERVAEYIDRRLREVQAATLKKELGCLRVFGESIGLPVATWPKLTRRQPGTKHPRGQRRAVAVSPKELRAILHGLPARDRWGGVVRLRYAFAAFTGLRPATIAKLTVPTNWHRRSAETLFIGQEIDKARAGRRLPLDRRARLILRWVAPKEGAIWGDADHRKLIKASATAVLGEERGKAFNPYDLRRALATHRIDAGAPLTGVQFLLGHASLATTARYALASEKSARDALNAGRAKGRARRG